MLVSAGCFPRGVPRSRPYRTPLFVSKVLGRTPSQWFSIQAHCPVGQWGGKWGDLKGGWKINPVLSRTWGAKQRHPCPQIPQSPPRLPERWSRAQQGLTVTPRTDEETEAQARRPKARRRQRQGLNLVPRPPVLPGQPQWGHPVPRITSNSACLVPQSSLARIQECHRDSWTGGGSWKGP